ncbi:MAG TPA: hypothetical protein VNK82_07895 [Terriglobales bacterium]|nr:hypothetical protein [Terriglobales bacterium]
MNADFDEVHGYPVVEILKNGGPIHQYDSHFRFGRHKAELLLACLPALREFGWSSDEERLRFQPRTFDKRELGVSVKVFVEMHPHFEWSTGELIEEPWLRLQAIFPDQSHLGLGVMKCRAVWSVQDDLRDWVCRVRTQASLGEMSEEELMAELKRRLKAKHSRWANETETDKRDALLNRD